MNVIASTDCPLCRHPLIDHARDEDLRYGRCRLCDCPGTGTTGDKRTYSFGKDEA